MAIFAAMTFPSDFERKIGFDRIRELLSANCLFGPGREEADRISFTADAGVILANLRQADEFRNILESGDPFPSQDFYDLAPSLSSIRTPGTYLEPERLSELKLSLLTISGIVSFLGKKQEECRALHDLVTEYCPDTPYLVSAITRLSTLISSILDEKSQIRSSASPGLQEIRRGKSVAAAQVEKRILALFKAARKSGWTPEDAEVTIRNGQLVIPVLSTHKRKISGFVRDESSTGQTVYLEPAELLELNNEIRELELAERREIIRILTAAANEIRPDIEVYLAGFRLLARIDLTRAKARLAMQIGGAIPLIPGNPSMNWRQAIHPLLYLSHRQQKKTVVPLDLFLSPDSRVLVISGPNAGGKSICLKTAGLIQYMFQCGILPCVKEDSEFMIFRNIFIDIGDEQSLENDLSTYTSKLLNLKYFIENLDDASLFLLDEMGTGTDPSLGGTIAEAALEEMAAKGSFGIVTTHYSNLKLLAGKVPGVINGAMLFDTKNIRPLYRLRIGQPGSSFAFEIAKGIGFPGKVLKRASEKTGHSQLDFDRQLQDLEVEKQDLTKKTTELNVADEFLNELISKYQKMNEELERSKKEIITQAREEAARILKDSNKLIEKTIREIREAQADKEKTKDLRKELEVMKEKLGNESQSHRVTESQTQETQKLKASKTQNLPPASPPELPPQSPYKSYMDELNRKLAYFQLTLDLRGTRVDEAYSLLQKYLDDAVLLSIPEVRILHGKGNGVLRQVTRDYLKSVNEVREFRDEVVERGGSGITVVKFR